MGQAVRVAVARANRGWQGAPQHGEAGCRAYHVINGLFLLMEFMNVLQSNVNGIWSYGAEGKLHAALHFQQLSARLDIGGSS